MDSNALLDAVKARHVIPSEYALAKKLGISQEALRKIRERGGLSDARALQVATLLELPEGEVLASIRAERAKDPAVKAAWKKVAESIRTALGLAAMVAVLLLLGTPPKVANASETPGAPKLSPAIHYARKRWKRFLARLACGLASIFALTLTPANADELRIGAGMNYGILQGDGVWQQHQPDANGDTLDNRIDNGAPVAVIQYVGTTRFRWLNYSIGIAHRDGPSASGEYVSDDCYYGTYGAVLFSGGPWSDSAGMPACDRRYFAKRVSTSTNAVTLTINPTWHVAQDFSLSAALGLSLFSTRLDMEWDRTRGVCQSESLCEDQTFRKRGATPYVELTARYSAVFVTGYYAHRENAPETMSDGNYGVVLGLAFPL